MSNVSAIADFEGSRTSSISWIVESFSSDGAIGITFVSWLGDIAGGYGDDAVRVQEWSGSETRRALVIWRRPVVEVPVIRQRDFRVCKFVSFWGRLRAHTPDDSVGHYVHTYYPCKRTHHPESVLPRAIVKQLVPVVGPKHGLIALSSGIAGRSDNGIDGL